MSTLEKISREAFKEQYPDIYEIVLASDEIGPLTKQAIVSFDITRSPKGRVKVADIHYSDLHTMVCQMCDRTYSEGEYKRSCKSEVLPCGHSIMDCFCIDSYPACKCGYYMISGHVCQKVSDVTR